MNLRKLELAKEDFLRLYPQGFEDSQMEEIRKKHKPEKMRQLAQETFHREAFSNPENLLNNISKLVARASMVSVFEKPRFRDFIKSLNSHEKELLTKGFEELLYGNQQFGFDTVLDILQYYKLGKWTLMTICPYYLKPKQEVFIKPTTAKMAINYFELKGLDYKPRPSYDFYVSYRERIKEMMDIVQITDDFAAFGGFIMITAGESNSTSKGS